MDAPLTDPYTYLDDATLLERAAADPSCFATLYHRYSDQVLDWLVARTADPHTATDIHAETFAVVYAKRHSFDPALADTALPWIYGIAYNELRRTWRRRCPSDRVRRQLAIPHIPLDDLSYERVEERFDTGQALVALQGAYDQLSPALAAAVTLRVVDGLTYDEVAAQLGCRVGTARVRVSRALALLHDLLDAS